MTSRGSREARDELLYLVRVWVGEHYHHEHDDEEQWGQARHQVLGSTWEAASDEQRFLALAAFDELLWERAGVDGRALRDHDQTREVAQFQRSWRHVGGRGSTANAGVRFQVIADWARHVDGGFQDLALSLRPIDDEALAELRRL